MGPKRQQRGLHNNLTHHTRGPSIPRRWRNTWSLHIWKITYPKKPYISQKCRHRRKFLLVRATDTIKYHVNLRWTLIFYCLSNSVLSETDNCVLIHVFVGTFYFIFLYFFRINIVCNFILWRGNFYKGVFCNCIVSQDRTALLVICYWQFLIDETDCLTKNTNRLFQ